MKGGVGGGASAAGCGGRGESLPAARRCGCAWEVPPGRLGLCKSRRAEPSLVGDHGSASVWGVGVIAVLCVVFGFVLAFGHAVVVRHRAAVAADLAALAVAGRWTVGPEEACAQADAVTRAQGTRLVRCVLVGEVSDVSVAAGEGPFAAEVRARAGPPEPSPPVPPPTGKPTPPSGDGR